MLSQTYLDNIEYTIFLCKSSVQRCSVKKVFLKIFTKFTEKHLCQSLFLNKTVSLRPVTLLKKRLGANIIEVTPLRTVFPQRLG